MPSRLSLMWLFSESLRSQQKHLHDIDPITLLEISKSIWLVFIASYTVYYRAMAEFSSNFGETCKCIPKDASRICFSG